MLMLFTLHLYKLPQLPQSVRFFYFFQECWKESLISYRLFFIAVRCCHFFSFFLFLEAKIYYFSNFAKMARKIAVSYQLTVCCGSSVYIWEWLRVISHRVCTKILREVSSLLFCKHHLFLSLAPLLSFLPSSTEELLTVYLRRAQQQQQQQQHNSSQQPGPQASTAVDAVMVDAISYVHASLLGEWVSHFFLDACVSWLSSFSVPLASFLFLRHLTSVSLSSFI